MKIENEILIPVNYISVGVLHRKWDFPYSDSYFLNSCQQYNKRLAQSSLGFSVSADRDSDLETREQNRGVKNFCISAGFENIQFYRYDTKPQKNTVAAAIASKKILDFTLIAVTVCGNGYGNEWIGNFTVGDSERHLGFSKGAELVKKDIESFVEQYKISGKIKMWFAGFSRAAAVLNLVAYDFKKQELCTDIFAYLFATPNVMKNSQSVAGLFNIVGRNDPFAMLPDERWDYGKNGTTLYLPAQDFDSDYQEKEEQAQVVSRQLCGKDFRTNPIRNAEFKTVYYYLSLLFPNSEHYACTLQPILQSIYENRTKKNIYCNIQEFHKIKKNFTLEQKKAYRKLRNYILHRVIHFKKDCKIQSELGFWDLSARLDTNLLKEHSGDMYVIWMFA